MKHSYLITSHNLLLHARLARITNSVVKHSIRRKHFSLLSNLTFISIGFILFLTLIQGTVLAYAQDWSAQSVQESVSTVLAPEAQIITLEKTEPKFNERHISYFEESTVQSYEQNKGVLSSFKEVLQSKIEARQAELQRIEQERVRIEEEKVKAEQEALQKREAEAKARQEAEAAKKAQEERAQRSAQAVSTQAVAPTGSKYDLMRAAGISESDFTYVDFIVSKESTWNHLIANKSSGAYGLCQSLPASKMASAGSDYMTNPVTQLKWCNGYAQSRYGGWANAYAFWQNKKWW